MPEQARSVILDNNFEDRNRAGLEKLIKEHPCNVITVRFDCDVAAVSSMMFTALISRRTFSS